MEEYECNAAHWLDAGDESSFESYSVVLGELHKYMRWEAIKVIRTHDFKHLLFGPTSDRDESRPLATKHISPKSGGVAPFYRLTSALRGHKGRRLSGHCQL